MNYSRIILFALYIFLAITVSGCWDYIEYEDMAQLIGMGIDYDNESQEITVTVQYASVVKQKGEQAGSAKLTPNGIVHSATDKTIAGAITKLQEVINKKLFYGYLKVLVIGEDAAKYQLMEIMDLLDRSPAFTTMLLVFSADKAENVIKTVATGGTTASGYEMHNLIHSGPNTGASFPVTTNEFLQMLAISGIEATAPRVINVEGKQDDKEGKGGSQGNIRFDGEQRGDFRMAGLAAFKGGQFVGWLDQKETLGFGWITGKKLEIYKASEPRSNVGIGDAKIYRVNEAETDLRAGLDNGNPVIDVDVKVTANIRKYPSAGNGEFLSDEDIKLAEKQLADGIYSDIDAALIRGQKELKTDIFGFGFAFFRKYPELWREKYEEEWTEIFPEVPVNINVEVHVINTGINIRKLKVK
ncbi:MAG: gerBC 2 [Firmicutes bacterium]|nr:gerBC 2 [Bacillota bacterium]